MSPHGQDLYNHLSQEGDLCHEPPRANTEEGGGRRDHEGGAERGTFKKQRRLQATATLELTGLWLRSN